MKTLAIQIDQPTTTTTTTNKKTDTKTKKKTTRTRKPTMPITRPNLPPLSQDIISKDILPQLETLNIREARFIIARTICPNESPLKTVVSAGYSPRSTPARAKWLRERSHVSYLLALINQVISTSESGQSPAPDVTLDAVKGELARIAINRGAPTRERLDAIKQLRDLQGWDKPKGSGAEQGGNPMDELLVMIDGTEDIIPSK
jgi:hypothetical protein